MVLHCDFKFTPKQANKYGKVKYVVKSYHWENLTFSKLRFSKFKKFVFRSVFGELQLTQI